MDEYYPEDEYESWDFEPDEPFVPDEPFESDDVCQDYDGSMDEAVGRIEVAIDKFAKPFCDYLTENGISFHRDGGFCECVIVERKLLEGIPDISFEFDNGGRVIITTSDLFKGLARLATLETPEMMELCSELSSMSFGIRFYLTSDYELIAEACAYITVESSCEICKNWLEHIQRFIGRERKKINAVLTDALSREEEET